MLNRKPLAPNNRTVRSLVREFRTSEALYVKYPKAKEEPSIFGHVRAGRQNSEGFGGGRVVGK